MAISHKGCLWPRAATASPRQTGGESRSPHTLEPAYMVHGYKVFWHIRSILWWSKFALALLTYNPLQFFLELIRGLHCINVAARDKDFICRQVRLTGHVGNR